MVIGQVSKVYADHYLHILCVIWMSAANFLTKFGPDGIPVVILRCHTKKVTRKMYYFFYLFEKIIKQVIPSSAKAGLNRVLYLQ